MQRFLSIRSFVSDGRHAQVLDPPADDGIARICVSDKDDKRVVTLLKIVL
jgi:hypothetical protein